MDNSKGGIANAEDQKKSTTSDSESVNQEGSSFTDVRFDEKVPRAEVELQSADEEYGASSLVASENNENERRIIIVLEDIQDEGLLSSIFTKLSGHKFSNFIQPETDANAVIHGEVVCTNCSVAESCEHFESKNDFSFIEDILRSQNFPLVIFKMCHGEASMIQNTRTQSISTAEFRQLQELVNERRSLKQALSDLNRKTTEESENDRGGTGCNMTVKADKFLTQIGKLEHLEQESIIKFNALMKNLVGRPSSALEKQNENGEHSNFCTPDSFNRREEPASKDSSIVENNSKPQTHSLPLLLQCLSERLPLIDRIKLSQYIALPNICQRCPENTPNGIQSVLQELVERCENRNLDFIRDAFYEIGRVDLVHLMDCIRDGDYSLLTEQQTGQRRIGSNNTSDRNGLSAPSLQRMQNMTFQENIDEEQATYESQYLRRSLTETARRETGYLRGNEEVGCNYHGSLSRISRPVQEKAQKNADFAGDVSTTTTRTETSPNAESTTDDVNNRQSAQAMGNSGDTSAVDRNCESNSARVETSLQQADERTCGFSYPTVRNGNLFESTFQSHRQSVGVQTDPEEEFIGSASERSDNEQEEEGEDNVFQATVDSLDGQPEYEEFASDNQHPLPLQEIEDVDNQVFPTMIPDALDIATVNEIYFNQHCLPDSIDLVAEL